MDILNKNERFLFDGSDLGFLKKEMTLKANKEFEVKFKTINDSHV